MDVDVPARWAYWRRLFWRRWVGIVTAFFGILAAAQAFRSELPVDLQNHLRFLPTWPLWLWTIVVLCSALVIAAEDGFREDRRLRQELTSRRNAKEIRDQLTKLWYEGRHCHSFFSDESHQPSYQPSYEAQVKATTDWETKTTRYIAEALELSYTTKFKSDDPGLHSLAVPASVRAEYRPPWRHTEMRLARLRSIIDELIDEAKQPPHLTGAPFPKRQA